MLFTILFMDPCNANIRNKQVELLYGSKGSWNCQAFPMRLRCTIPEKYLRGGEITITSAPRFDTYFGFKNYVSFPWNSLWNPKKKIDFPHKCEAQIQIQHAKWRNFIPGHFRQGSKLLGGCRGGYPK